MAKRHITDGMICDQSHGSEMGGWGNDKWDRTSWQEGAAWARDRYERLIDGGYLVPVARSVVRANNKKQKVK